MSTILDLVHSARKVPVLGKDIEVFGVSAEGIAAIVSRFPLVGKAMSGMEVTGEDVMSMAPEAISAIIAAGCGEPGNEKAEKIAAKLPAEAQLDLVQAILKQTFPSGVGPFVEKLKELGVLARAESQRLQSSPELPMNSSEPVTKSRSK